MTFRDGTLEGALPGPAASAFPASLWRRLDLPSTDGGKTLPLKWTIAEVIRFETLRDLVSFRGAMDRFFDEALGGSLGSYGPVGTPAVDLYQTEEDIVLKATLPGVAANVTSRSR